MIDEGVIDIVPTTGWQFFRFRPYALASTVLRAVTALATYGCKYEGVDSVRKGTFVDMADKVVDQVLGTAWKTAHAEHDAMFVDWVLTRLGVFPAGGDSRIGDVEELLRRLLLHRLSPALSVGANEAQVGDLVFFASRGGGPKKLNVGITATSVLDTSNKLAVHTYRAETADHTFRTNFVISAEDVRFIVHPYGLPIVEVSAIPDSFVGGVGADPC